MNSESSASRRMHVLQQQVDPSHTHEQVLFTNFTSSTQSGQVNLSLRLLQVDDYHKGFLQILGQLAVVGEVSFDQFKKRLEEQKKVVPQTYFTVVIEDVSKSKIIATSTLIVEMKFTHGCSRVGHIEDVVVDETYRGYKLGKRVIDECKRIATEQGCYKTILDCSEKNVPFYESCGFKKKEVQMRYDNH